MVLPKLRRRRQQHVPSPDGGGGRRRGALRRAPAPAPRRGGGGVDKMLELVRELGGGGGRGDNQRGRVQGLRAGAADGRRLGGGLGVLQKIVVQIRQRI